MSLTHEQRRKAHLEWKEKVAQSYDILNKAADYTLDQRLGAIACALKHGTTGGVGTDAAIDRLTQGMAFVAEALQVKARDERLAGLLEEIQKRHSFDAADREMLRCAAAALRGIQP